MILLLKIEIAKMDFNTVYVNKYLKSKKRISKKSKSSKKKKIIYFL